MGLAIASFNQGDRATSLNAFKKLLVHFPDNEAVLFNYAYVLGTIGRFSEEQALLRRLIALSPETYDARVNLSVSLNSCSRFKDSNIEATSAIAIQPNLPHAYEVRAVSNLRLGRLRESIYDYMRFFEFNFPWAQTSEEVRRLIEVCLELIDLPLAYDSSAALDNKWLTFKNNLRKALSAASQIDPRIFLRDHLGPHLAFAISSFSIPYLQRKDDVEILRKLASLTEILLAYQTPSEAEEIESSRPACPKTIAVISTFRYHPEVFIFDQIEDLDLNAFKIELFVVNNPSYNPPSQHSSNFEHEHVELRAATVHSFIARIKSSRYDFVFFPEVGMSVESRVLSSIRLGDKVFTTWLHPVTSGAKSVDWFFSATDMETCDSDTHYSERLIRLPGVGLKIKKDTAAPSPKKAFDNDSSGEKFLIGCIQNPIKLHPDYDYVYLSILRKIPNVIFNFVLGIDKASNEVFLSRFTALLQKEGFRSERCTKVLPSMDKVDFLAFLEKMDCILDPPGWSGGNTTIDCLNRGLPVFSVPASTMRSRHTKALFHSISKKFIYTNVDELIIGLARYGSLSHYEKKLVREAIYSEWRGTKHDCSISRFLNKLDRLKKKHLIIN